jgi:TatD DNase family protein
MSGHLRGERTLYIDAHAHIDRYSDQQIPQVLAQLAAQQQLTISVAMDPAAYARAGALAQRSPWIIPTFGIHPWEAPRHAGDLAALWPLIDASPMIGEIGLDFHWVEDRAAYPAQRAVFAFFLDAAHAQGKVVNLHTKGAEAEILELLERHHVERAIVHWYSGPPDIADALAARGALFTIGVEVHTSALIQDLARRLPLGQLLTETDNPGGAEWLTGAPGMPAELPGVVEALARLRGLDPAELCETIRANVIHLIDGDPHMDDMRARLDER